MAKKIDREEGQGRNSGSSVPASGVSLGRRPAAGTPALQCAVAEGSVVVAELRQLRQTTSPCLDSVKLVLDTTLDILSSNTADLQQCSMPWLGPKLGIRAPGNIRQRLNADERHTANADIHWQSQEESVPRSKGHQPAEGGAPESARWNSPADDVVVLGER